VSLWIIIPVKGLATGKTRLAPRLDGAQRRELNERLLRRALNAAAGYGSPARTLVVSACEAALRLAREFGAEELHELGEPALNSALHSAADHARARSASELLILHADLPRVTTEDLAALIETGRAEDAVASATNRDGTGTNALYLPSAAPFVFRFGENSRALHIEAACAADLAFTEMRIAGLAFDVDTPQDLAELDSCLASREVSRPESRAGIASPADRPLSA
jgi:2-phospho-L-lactate guanylyltransferase